MRLSGIDHYTDNTIKVNAKPMLNKAVGPRRCEDVPKVIATAITNTITIKNESSLEMLTMLNGKEICANSAEKRR